SLNEFHRVDAPVAPHDFDRLREPMKLHTFETRVVVLEGEGRHFLLGAAIEQVYLGGPQSHSRVGRVDRRVAAPDHHNRTARLKIGKCLVPLDETERINDPVQVLSGNREALHGSESDSDEQKRKLLLEVFQKDIAAGLLLSKLDTHRSNEVHFS